MKTVIEVFYILMIFGGGIVLGYYFGLVREHRIFMAKLDKLKADLTYIDEAKWKARTAAGEKWESRSKN
jgi:hypothetical protein